MAIFSGINKDETAISAAKREMFEEVGIKFQSTIIIGETGFNINMKFLKLK